MSVPQRSRGGEREVDARSDLFSLGITFHELLTGRRVFQKDNEVGVLLAMMGEEMQKATAGLNLPGGLPGGLKLPF